MRQTFVSILMIAVLLLTVTSCSSGSNTIAPLVKPEMATSSVNHVAQTHLWGYYDVYVDINAQTATAVPNRQAMFTANVVTFLNGKYANLGFHINSIPVGPDYVDVDIDVSLTHPLPGQPQYNGYDVRGVFMGDGSATLQYNTDLHYPVLGTDQFMLADSVDGFGGPDGYTRWFNKPEFSTGGLPILQYTQGKLATPNFNGSATLNAYKYFADGLGKNENLWDWLNNHASEHGQFSSGATHTRNYYLRFPNTKGVKYSYAVLANWGGETSELHPSNTPEAVACNVVDNSNVYYVDSSNKGGNLILDISLFGWSQQPSTIFIESTVLSIPHEFTLDEMTPTFGTENYSTYHVEISADNVTSTDNNELWIIAQYNAFDYTNEFGVSNLAYTDKLSSLFTRVVTVSSEAPHTTGWARTWGGSAGDWADAVVSDTQGNSYTLGRFQDTVDFDPGDGADFRTSNGNYDIFFSKFDAQGNYQWVRTWGGTEVLYQWDGDAAVAVVMDDLNNVYAFGEVAGVTDFDPSTGLDLQGKEGVRNYFISKFDSQGSYQWARVWDPSIGWTSGWSVAMDICNSNVLCIVGWYNPGGYLIRFNLDGDYLGSCALEGIVCGLAAGDSDDIYVSGYFVGTVDFDPGDGVDYRTADSNGSSDAYMRKFDANGVYQWVRTWGGPSIDGAHDAYVDNLGDVCVLGTFSNTVDFDPGPGVDEHSAGNLSLSKFDNQGNFKWAETWWGGFSRSLVTDLSGDIYIAGDAYLSKFDTQGNHQWIRVWPAFWGTGVSVYDLGVYVTGRFEGTIDFAPHDPPCVTDPDNHNSVGSSDSYLIKFLPDGCW